MWRQARLTQTVETNQLRHFIELCHLVTLSVSEIIWCWWQISKWLWCIGRLILATDSWSTETDLSHWHSTTIIIRQADQRMNRILCTDMLLPDYLSLFIVLCFVYFYGFNRGPQILPDNPQVDTKNKYRSWLTFGSIVFSPFFENAYGPKCITLS